MGESAQRYRARARQCRELAAAAKDELQRKTLERMADELDQEASLIEAEAGEGGE